MSYPVDVPPSPAIAGTPITTAIAAQSYSTSATDLTVPSQLTQTISTPLPESIAIHQSWLQSTRTPTSPSPASQPPAILITATTAIIAPTDNRSSDTGPSQFSEPSATPLPPAATPVSPTFEPIDQPPPINAAPSNANSNEPQIIPISAPPEELAAEGVIELLADTQSYSRDRQVFTAAGNVSMRFRNSLLVADRLQVNLGNRFAVAEGTVTLVRGQQVLQGNRFEYNFVQGTGRIQGIRGEIFIPELSDITNDPQLARNIPPERNMTQSIGSQVYTDQPAQNIQPGIGLNVTAGSNRNTSGQPSAVTGAGGAVNRLRFEADSAEFSPTGLIAENVRITNDPFSPPELELRSPRVVVTRISPLRDEVKAEKPRLVFDQRFKLPLLLSRTIIDRRERRPALAQIGYDGEDRGGLFISRGNEIIQTENWRLVITPELMIQRIFDEGLNLRSFGVGASLEGQIGPRTSLIAQGILNTLKLDEADDNLRARFQARQLIGTHNLALEASYRERLFNNSLGFQDVRNSYGILFYSPPVVALGNTGITANYQVGYRRVNADTDVADLLPPIRSNNRATLNRFQASFNLSRGFNLWRGQPLPPTADQGVRYTPVPLAPYLNLVLGLTGTTNFYSNGSSQSTIGGNISLVGQFGRSVKNFFDYTAFNLTYSNSALTGLSPFLFDRAADTQVLYAGVTQQIYGPWRLGFQTAWNLDTGNEFSTDYLLEYSRRTYSVLVRYNPVQQLGSINLQVRDFNWTGGTEAFGGTGVRTVTDGVIGPAN